MNLKSLKLKPFLHDIRCKEGMNEKKSTKINPFLLLINSAVTFK